MKLKNVPQKKYWLLLFLSLIPLGSLICGGYFIFEEFIGQTHQGIGINSQEFSSLIESDKPAILVLNLTLINDRDQYRLGYDVGNLFVILKNIPSGICIKGAFIRTPQIISSGNFLFEVEQPDYSFENYCATPIANSTSMYARVPKRINPLSLQVNDRIDERFFPFDEWGTGSTFLWLDIRDENDQPITLELEIIPNVITPDWKDDLSLRSIQITVNGQETYAYQIDITLKRLASIRFFTVLLIAMSVFVITAIFLIKEPSTVIELILAILLGLWGIQSVLIPAGIQMTTLTHVLLILLYVYLAVVVFLRFFFLPLARKLIEARVT